MMTLENLDVEAVRRQKNENRLQIATLYMMNDNIWLSYVLDEIGARDDYRKICQKTATTIEIIDSFTGQFTSYCVGSVHEGTVTPGVISDTNVIRCDEEYPVIEDISNADKNQISLLIVTESETSAGYVKLQLVVGSIPCMLKHWPHICDFLPLYKEYFRIDRFERVVLSDLINITEENFPLLSRPKNKPAAKLVNVFEIMSSDTVVCYRCKLWPTEANEWLSRSRYNGWPTTNTINELKSLGFFVVKRGHPYSQETNLEWRISLSLQERQLIRNLTDVQYKCYVILKMLNRDVLRLDCITSYHWKTCLFYIIEENEAIVWENKLLFHCVRLCITRMLIWVKRGCCPNYFIPKENMFHGRMIDSLRVISENKLVDLLNDGFDCLLQVNSNYICDYVRSRNNLKMSEDLRIKSIQSYRKAAYMKTVVTHQCVMMCLGIILKNTQFIRK